jgi:hypothetical protein
MFPADPNHPRALAKKASEKRYYTGKPCKHGHISERDTISGSCIRCTRQATKLWTKKKQARVKRTARRWKERHPDRVKANAKAGQLRRHQRRIESMGARPAPTECEICGGVSERRVLMLDHCHKTGKFRGWLCLKCNSGLGMFRDSQMLLLKAFAYLADNGIATLSPLGIIPSRSYHESSFELLEQLFGQDS